MIEPELAFADLNDDMACATAYLQYVVGVFLYIFIWWSSLLLAISAVLFLLKPLVY